MPAEPAECTRPGTALVPLSPKDALNRIEKLPRDIGWMLLAGGLMSEVVMGLPPFWVLGILILYPQIGGPLTGFLERKAPRLLTGSLDFVDRYLGDLERRYPRR
ncbi:MAG: hypothetical protein AB1648_10740 [Pseudomonadota bacterium]